MVFDWSGLIPRHPNQVMREQDLRVGDAYARVRMWAWPPERIEVNELVFVGTYSVAGPAPPGRTESRIIDRIRDKGWLHRCCLSLHADGWMEDHYALANTPTAAIWANGRLINLAFADTMFGLGDVSDNNERGIVVPQADWCSNPVVALSGDARCPDCKGTGTIMLLTSSVPCACREGRATQ